MILARTIVVFCFAAVAMAGSCQQPGEEVFDSWWPRRGRMNYMMEGKRCKCKSKSVKEDEIWTKNTCSYLEKDIRWCYGEAEDYCETGNAGGEFSRLCSERGKDCYAVDC
ncbi:hypothetical protein BG004_003483 [Podila humilis]|nr:hypothetical protein BG004_003483 [Podila humilis]